MIKRRIPMDVFVAEAYRVMTEYQDSWLVFDKVPQKSVPPYAEIGEFTAKQVGAKDSDVWDVSLQIHLWSTYAGKSEINLMADDFTLLLTSWPLDLSASYFAVLSQDIDMFEAFPDELYGYHGILTLVATVQNLGLPS
jgi:hypothetical protein